MAYNFPTRSGCNVTLPGPSLQTLCSAAEYVTFMTALNAAITINPDISGNCKRITPKEELLEEYDFIVVGGGGGGAVVAGRLAEVSNWKIAVLEAGHDEPASTQIPGLASTILETEINWNYFSSNERSACLARNGSCNLPAGRVLGGNTAINHMIYMRGYPKDYDNWAALGNDGWKWADVLPYFKKQEDNGNIDKVGCEYHSTGGPLAVEISRYVLNSTGSFLTGANQSGFGVTNDLNGKVISGMTVHQSTQKNGVRVSSSRAYLWPHRNNTNLHISLNSFVTKVIITNGTAVGVEYMKNGKLRRVYAKKEVIVAAGSIRSPQLLSLSGIGPKKELESKGINVVADVPGVGNNLHDHMLYLIPLTMNGPNYYANDESVARQYVQNQTGLLTTTGGLFVIGAGHTNKTTQDFPDFRMGVQGFTANCAPGPVHALRSNGRQTLNFWVASSRPESRGKVTLASNNPSDPPTVWVNYLNKTNDLEVLVDGINQGLKWLKTEALKKFDIRLAVQPLAACSNYTVPSDKYWACALRQEARTEWHLVGTNKMGPASDPMAVVDSKLRVRKIKNLRVVDASIMPQVTSANTMAPTMMIGERGADFIKETWLKPTDKIVSPWGKPQSCKK